MADAPDLGAYRADILVVDVPILVGLEAIGLRTKVVDQLAGRIRIGSRAGGEFLEWKTSGASGIDFEAPELPSPLPSFEAATQPERLREIAEATSALARAWTVAPMSAIRAHSLAAAYATARERGVLIATNAIEVWRISRARAASAGTRASVGGTAELLLYLVDCGLLDPAHAWENYQSLAVTIAGTTPGWRLYPEEARERTCKAFMGWADEARSGRM